MNTEDDGIKLQMLTAETILMSAALVVLLCEGKISQARFDEITGTKGNAVRAMGNMEDAKRKWMDRLSAEFN